MLPVFIFDTHQDEELYFYVFLRHAMTKRAILKNARLVFWGDYSWGYPIIEKSKGDKVYGTLTHFTTKEAYEKFESCVRNTRQNWRFKKLKAVVKTDDGDEVKCLLFAIEPYTKDRGTFRGRKEIPLKECYEAMLKIYKKNKFPQKVLRKALLDTLSEYYSEKFEFKGVNENG